jgi:putative membrane protein
MTPAPLPPEDPNTRLAGERTLLAWVRTGLAMMGFGFVVARFGFFLREVAVVGNLKHKPNTGFSLWIGTTLVMIGVVASLLAAWQHYGFLRRIESRLPYRAPRWSLGIIVAVLLAFLGAVMAVYLVILEA